MTKRRSSSYQFVANHSTKLFSIMLNMYCVYFFDVQCASIAESNCCRGYSLRIPWLILEDPMSKFIFVTGGVASSVGKGITVASLGRLLKNRGISVSLMKLDPYINVDPGTMSHSQHGEVFVTDDGAEPDVDLGHYARLIE